jgi:hypothetical protein
MCICNTDMVMKVEIYIMQLNKSRSQCNEHVKRSVDM